MPTAEENTIHPQYWYETPDIKIISKRYEEEHPSDSVYWTSPITAANPYELGHTLEERLSDLKKKGDKLLIPYNRSQAHWVGVVVEKGDDDQLKIKILDSSSNAASETTNYNIFADTINSIRATKEEELQRLKKRQEDLSILIPNLDSEENFEKAKDRASNTLEQYKDMKQRELDGLPSYITPKENSLKAWPNYKTIKAAPSITVWQQSDACTCGGYTLENLRREGYQEEIKGNITDNLGIRAKHAIILPYTITTSKKLTEDTFDKRMNIANGMAQMPNRPLTPDELKFYNPPSPPPMHNKTQENSLSAPKATKIPQVRAEQSISELDVPTINLASEINKNASKELKNAISVWIAASKVLPYESKANWEEMARHLKDTDQALLKKMSSEGFDFRHPDSVAKLYEHMNKSTNIKNPEQPARVKSPGSNHTNSSNTTTPPLSRNKHKPKTSQQNAHSNTEASSNDTKLYPVPSTEENGVVEFKFPITKQADKEKDPTYCKETSKDKKFRYDIPVDTKKPFAGKLEIKVPRLDQNGRRLKDFDIITFDRYGKNPILAPGKTGESQLDPDWLKQIKAKSVHNSKNLVSNIRANLRPDKTPRTLTRTNVSVSMHK